MRRKRKKGGRGGEGSAEGEKCDVPKAYCGRHSVQLSGAMIGDHNTPYTMPEGFPSILCCQDPLQDDRE